ncbi:hypothetical protein [Candidatus Cytomitobacter primus]|uniref:Uncharacterized protein n=2 Tax=Candidatus Cytomitobacter primus TaxID=2066024 RepID=A0A5C0UIS0_9PROT|nr:hypothetical protein [Candidatus Cytomitobacter primus]QEK38774.1 hypothetical protein FZC34_02575 [Candidatus Cytomitobacter primus]
MKNLRILSLVLCLSVMANGPELTECTSKFAYCLKSPGLATEDAVQTNQMEKYTQAIYDEYNQYALSIIPSLEGKKLNVINMMQIGYETNEDDAEERAEYINDLNEGSLEELYEGLTEIEEHTILRYVYESRPYIMKQSARYAELADAYGNYDMDGDVFKNAVYLADRSQNGTLEVDWDLESDRLEAHSLYYNSIYEYNLENPGLSMLSDKAEAAKVNATILQSLSKDKEHFTNIAKHIALKKMAVEAAKGLEKFKIMLDEVVRQDASWNVIRTVKVGNAMQKHFKEADKYVSCQSWIQVTDEGSGIGTYRTIFGSKDRIKFAEIIDLFNTDRAKCKETVLCRFSKGLENYNNDFNRLLLYPDFNIRFDQLTEMTVNALEDMLNAIIRSKLYYKVGNGGGDRKFQAYYPGEERRGDVEFFKKDYADWYAKSDGDKAVTALRKEEAAKLAKERDHEDYIVHLFDRAEELLNGYEGDKDMMGEIFGNFLFLRWAEYKENARGRDFMNSAKDALEGMLKLESSDIEKLNAISNEKIKSLQ